MTITTWDLCYNEYDQARNALLSLYKMIDLLGAMQNALMDELIDLHEYSELGFYFYPSWFISNPELCDHEEWVWEEGERFCLICGSNLTSGINWSQVADLERKWEEERDQPGDPEEEIVDGEFIEGELDPIEHVLYMKDRYPLLPDSKDTVL